MRPQFSIATLSLGTNVHHSLPDKLRVAAQLGYDAVELFIPDFEAFVREVACGAHPDVVPATSLEGCSSTRDLELACAAGVRALCDRLHLDISCFQPFRDFENFPGASSGSCPRLDIALDRAVALLRLMPVLRTSLLLVCSNFLPVNPIREGKTSWAQYADDQVEAFSRLGRLAARYGVKVGYESLAWGTCVCRWEQVWEVVERVDMENVGVILDSFNCLGQQYADPSMPDCVRPLPLAVLTDNLAHLSRTIPASKIFFYQLADAARPPAPITDYPTFPARMAWSRKTRLFPEERTGFLPVREFTQAVLRAGYTGVWSLEVFNASLDGMSPLTVVEHGHRGLVGLHRHWEECGGERPSAEGASAGLDVAVRKVAGQITPGASPPTKRQAFGEMEREGAEAPAVLSI